MLKKIKETLVGKNKAETKEKTDSDVVKKVKGDMELTDEQKSSFMENFQNQ